MNIFSSRKVSNMEFSIYFECKSDGLVFERNRPVILEPVNLHRKLNIISI